MESSTGSLYKCQEQLAGTGSGQSWELGTQSRSLVLVSEIQRPELSTAVLTLCIEQEAEARSQKQASDTHTLIWDLVV